jgi:hypothetical protein
MKKSVKKSMQIDSATSLMATKSCIFLNFDEVPKPSRSVNLGFVNLGNDFVPKADKVYPLVSANDEYLANLKYPDTHYKRLNLDLFSFYVDDLPDFTKDNEGLLKISINTRNPQDLGGSESDVTVATNFNVRDKHYAPSFLFKGVYRNVLFENWVNLKFDLFELDSDANVYFKKVKDVMNGVPEIKNLDVLKGIPYLNLATQLFESIITVFGKNSDDQIWGEIPIMEIQPTIGGAFLRSGIYIMFEEKNDDGDTFNVSEFEYLNGKLQMNDNSKNKSMPNHLIFGIKLENHVNV